MTEIIMTKFEIKMLGLFTLNVGYPQMFADADCPKIMEE